MTPSDIKLEDPGAASSQNEPQAAPVPPTPVKLNIVTVVWGEWHISAFLALNVPTLLAANNLPYMSEHCEARFLIYTTAADVEKIQSSQGYRWIRRLMPVRINVIPEEVAISDPIRAHRDVWFGAIEEAMRDNVSVLFMHPDVVWADGSLRHVTNLLLQGKKVIYNFYLRVVGDTFAKDFLDRYTNLDGGVAVPAREMVEFSVRHIHPLMAAYCRESDHFPHHPEMVIWPVRGEGLLVRVLARECLMFDPNAYQLNARALVDGKPVRSEIEFISDSDDFFAVSLMPLGKDMDWCLQRQKVEQTWLARWWLHYDSKLNDLVAATKVRIHYAEPTKSEWNKAELGSDLFVHRAAVYREALRVWRALPELKCERSAELLAMAMQNGAIQHLTQQFGRLVIFVPSDDGIDLIPEQRLAAIVHGSNGHRLKDLIRRHLVLLAEDEDDLDTSLARGPQAELTALDGRKIVISRRQNGSDTPQLIVNGKYPISAMIPSGPNLIIRLEGNLLTDASLPLRSAHRLDDSQTKGINS